MTTATAAPTAMESASESPHFFAIPVSKLVVMSFVTFGPYDLYWMYANWRLERYLVSLASMLALIPVQRAANALNARERPSVPPNDRFSALNWMGIVVGGLLVALAIWGTFLLPA